jgi:hypothetical protein
MRSWESYLHRIHVEIMDALGPDPNSSIDRVVFNSDLWPRLTPRSLLGRFSTQNVAVLSRSWKTALISFGKAFTYFHRAQRLAAMASRGQFSDFFKELENNGYENWDVEACPDWLLIQVRHLYRPSLLLNSHVPRSKAAFCCDLIKQVLHRE